eukprot:m.99909 g.99909  ORF g.99909 m.99909 type:complete len:101 (-) comp15364_c0_seq2:501-803(-)
MNSIVIDAAAPKLVVVDVCSPDSQHAVLQAQTSHNNNNSYSNNTFSEYTTSTNRYKSPFQCGHTRIRPCNNQPRSRLQTDLVTPSPPHHVSQFEQQPLGC